jgi:hypothetical protein
LEGGNGGGATVEALLEELDALGEELDLLLGQGGPSLKLLELLFRSRRCHGSHTHSYDAGAVALEICG